VIYHTLPRVKKKLIKYVKSDRVVFDLVKKQLNLFEINANHPSLRVHKLHGEFEGYWSLSINRSLRMIYFIENNEAYFIDIGTHNEVYRLN
jgi:addiction module RelE/StbE family toxin